MELKDIVKEQIRSLEYQKSNLIKSMKEMTDSLSEKLEEETQLDMYLTPNMLNLQRYASEYNTVQGKLSSLKMILIQLGE